MKRLAVIVLSLLLGVWAVGCKDKPTTTDIYPQIKVSTIELTVGQQPDWSKVIKVMLGDEELDNSSCVVTLTDGNPEDPNGGRCIYKITYTYKGTEITQRAYVNYIKQSGGSTSVDEKSDLQKMLEETFGSYTCRYRFTIQGDDAFYVAETDKVSGLTAEVACDEYDIDTQTSVQSKHFVRENGDGTVSIFYQAADESWTYADFTYEYYVANLTAYMPYAFLLSECELTDGMFEGGADGVYTVKTSYLDLVAQAVFNFDLSSADVYRSITVTVADRHIISIEGVYDSADDAGDYTAVVKYSWSDFDSTTVTLPDAQPYEIPAPDHISPDGAIALTAGQKTSLTAGLACDYQQASYSYTNDKGELNMLVTEAGEADGDKLHMVYTEKAVLDGLEKWSESSELYLKQNIDSIDAYVITDEQHNWQHQNIADATLDDYAAYFTPADLALNADWFGYKQDLFVVTGDSLTAAQTALNGVFGFDAAFDAYELITFTVKLDSANKLTEWYMLLKFTARGNTDYWQLTYRYADIDTASVSMPDEQSLRAVTTDEKTALTAALAADISNVTVTASDGTTARFAGQNVRVDGVNNHEPFTDRYYIEGDNYYEVIVDQNTAIPHEGDVTTQTGFDYFVPHFHFAAVTETALNGAQYDIVTDSYVLDAAAVDIQSFIYYWYYPEYTCTQFCVTVADGKVTSVTARFTATVQDTPITFTLSARFTDYGTTSADAAA